MGTAEGLLPIVLTQNVTLQVEASGEFLLAAVFGAGPRLPLATVDLQPVQVQEPGVVELLLALCTRHLN